MAKKPKLHPNIKAFIDATKGLFTQEEENKLASGNMKVEFHEDGESWKFSLDGDLWHDGKYPSGLNVIRAELDKILASAEEPEPKKKAKRK